MYSAGCFEVKYFPPCIIYVVPLLPLFLTSTYVIITAFFSPELPRGKFATILAAAVCLRMKIYLDEVT